MKKEIRVVVDDNIRKLRGIFDYNCDGTSSFEVPELPPVPEDFSIGVIVGPSGSGKSSILETMGGAPTYEWDKGKAVISHFEDAEAAAELFGAVGFNSIPAWVRPYHVLSTGEKFRVDMARGLKTGAIFDEFTSVVDRNVAKSCANALRRYVEKGKAKRIVLATCHYDVLEWLMPDWVYDTGARKMLARGCLQRPKIVVRISPCCSEAWSMFRDHHYLSGKLNNSARCWIATWHGVPVGFASALAFPNGSVKRAWREHRTVVLPDFQGLGIGVRLSDAIAMIFKRNGCRYFSKTAHPRMGEYRERSSLWAGTSKNKKARDDYSVVKTKTKEDKHKHLHAARVCYSHEFIAPPVKERCIG